MIITKRVFQDAPQMSVIESDYVVQALATYAANDSLRERILPWTSWCGAHFANTHSLNSFLEIFTIDSISITNEITWRLIFWKGLNDLLCRPRRRRMFGHIKVNQAAALM